MSNIFKQFHDFQSRKVDHPEYKPLVQPILEKTPTKEEVRNAKRREYMRNYYEKNKERMREYQREYHRNHSNKLPKKYGLKGVQLSVYNYMIEQYQLCDRVPRGTQIAKALNIGEQTVYNAVFSLVKKGLIGRGQAGKYYLINTPVKEDEIKKELEVMGETFDESEMVYVEEDKYDEIIKENESLKNKVKDLEAVASKKSRKHIDGEDYSPGYVGQLKHSIRTGQKIINELKERVVYLEEKLEKVQWVEVNEENKSDYLKKLEDQNHKLADEVIALRKIVKYLSKYID